MRRQKLSALVTIGLILLLPLSFANAHFPIMTTHLALLQNYEFEFKARIVSRNVGWIVKGTRRFRDFVPTFCIMFNINVDGELVPHIFNINRLDRETHYHVFDGHKITLSISKQGWFTLVTRVAGDRISVLNDGAIVFDEDFTADPYGPFYDYDDKQGQVGFRCHPGEQAVVNYATVREIEGTPRETAYNAA